MAILSEIDTLHFVNNKDIFLDNLFKLAAFQCLVQVDMVNNPPIRREAIMVEQHVPRNVVGHRLQNMIRETWLIAWLI